MQKPVETQTHAIKYKDINAALGPIGGMTGLLVMLPAVLPDISPELLEAVENGIRKQEPVDMTITLVGLRYEINLRADEAGPDGC